MSEHSIYYILMYFLISCIYLVLERGEGREKERERERKREKHQCVVASRVPPTWDLDILVYF